MTVISGNVGESQDIQTEVAMKSYIRRQAGMLNPDSNRRPQTFGRRLG